MQWLCRVAWCFRSMPCSRSLKKKLMMLMLKLVIDGEYLIGIDFFFFGWGLYRYLISSSCMCCHILFYEVLLLISIVMLVEKRQMTCIISVTEILVSKFWLMLYHHLLKGLWWQSDPWGGSCCGHVSQRYYWKRRCPRTYQQSL